MLIVTKNELTHVTRKAPVIGGILLFGISGLMMYALLSVWNTKFLNAWIILLTAFPFLLGVFSIGIEAKVVLTRKSMYLRTFSWFGLVFHKTEEKIPPSSKPVLDIVHISTQGSGFWAIQLSVPDIIEDLIVGSGFETENKAKTAAHEIEKWFAHKNFRKK